MRAARSLIVNVVSSSNPCSTSVDKSLNSSAQMSLSLKGTGIMPAKPSAETFRAIKSPVSNAVLTRIKMASYVWPDCLASKTALDRTGDIGAIEGKDVSPATSWALITAATLSISSNRDMRSVCSGNRYISPGNMLRLPSRRKSKSTIFSC